MPPIPEEDDEDVLKDGDDLNLFDEDDDDEDSDEEELGEDLFGENKEPFEDDDLD